MLSFFSAHRNFFGMMPHLLTISYLFATIYAVFDYIQKGSGIYAKIK